MRAIRYSEYGDPAVLHIDDVPPPVCGDDQVLVRVHATAVHPWDTKLRSGSMQQWMPLQLPHTPGIDFAGVVESAGKDVSRFIPGEAVMGAGKATYAELALASPAAIVHKPSALSFIEAATVPVGACTAWAAVIDAAGVAEGQRVLIHGGAGGVGMYAVQLAHARGAHVIATASAANADAVVDLGADEVIDYTSRRFEEAVTDVDAVIDTVGGDVIDRSFAVVRRGGILVTIAGQPPAEAGEEFSVRVASVNAKVTSDRLHDIVEMIEAGTLETEPVRTYPLAQAAAAHAASETRHGRGRLVLVVEDGLNRRQTGINSQ